MRRARWVLSVVVPAVNICLLVSEHFPISTHMLRHATGYKLANDGVDTRSLQDYLGHASIASTVRYTKLSPRRFRNFWND